MSCRKIFVFHRELTVLESQLMKSLAEMEPVKQVREAYIITVDGLVSCL